MASALTAKTSSGQLDALIGITQPSESVPIFSGGRTRRSADGLILPIQEIVRIFKADFDGRPTGPLDATGEINVGELKRIGAAHEFAPKMLTVKPMPTAENPAHAEIPEKISTGLSKSIIRKLKISRMPR
jgi:hypothetical protein